MNIDIRISTYYQDAETDQSDRIHQAAKGTLYTVGDSYIIEYDSNIFNEQEMEHNRVTIHPDGVCLLRSGRDMQTKIDYIKGQTTSFRYALPYGSIDCRVDTKEIESYINEGFGGHLRIQYDLYMNDALGGHHQLKMLFTRQ